MTTVNLREFIIRSNLLASIAAHPHSALKDFFSEGRGGVNLLVDELVCFVLGGLVTTGQKASAQSAPHEWGPLHQVRPKRRVAILHLQLWLHVIATHVGGLASESVYNKNIRCFQCK